MVKLPWEVEMKRIAVILIIALFVFGTLSCKKKEAEKAVEKQAQTQKEEPATPQQAFQEFQKGMEAFGKSMEKMAEQMGQAGKGEVIDYKKLKEALPKVSGWKVDDVSAGKTSFGNFSTSQASATYIKGDASVRVEITDVAGVKMFFTPIFMLKNMKYERETATGYEKTVSGDNFFGKESFDKESRSGELVVIYGDRFLIQLEGSGIDSADVLKEFFKKIDFTKLK